MNNWVFVTITYGLVLVGLAPLYVARSSLREALAISDPASSGLRWVVDMWFAMLVLLEVGLSLTILTTASPLPPGLKLGALGVLVPSGTLAFLHMKEASIRWKQVHPELPLPAKELFPEALEVAAYWFWAGILILSLL